MKVWALSDVHTDYKENLSRCQELGADYSDDAVILAGDVTDDLDIFEATLRCFTEHWQHVFFTPGNHDLWTRKAERGRHNSSEKLKLLQELCTEAGVHTTPQCVDNVWIVPLYSWYHASFDKEPDIPGALPAHKLMTDFHACSWPESLNALDTSLAAHFDQMNQEPVADALTAIQAQTNSSGKRPCVITFSHFLPLQELLPEKRMLYQPNLAKAAGSDFLAKRMQQIQPTAHIFGHTHFNWDATNDGVRYIQRPLGYPQERRRWSEEGQWQPALVYDTVSGMSCQRNAHWSSYYQHNSRRPDIIDPAPWVSIRASAKMAALTTA